MTVPDGSDGQRSGVHIGRVDGSAFAIGDDNTVTNTNISGPAPERDPAHEELLQAVRDLRAHLSCVVADDRTAALDAELAETESEIEENGRAGRGRLIRLRQAVADADAVTSVLASGVTVAQAVAALLGG